MGSQSVVDIPEPPSAEQQGMLPPRPPQRDACASVTESDRPIRKVA